MEPRLGRVQIRNQTGQRASQLELPRRSHAQIPNTRLVKMEPGDDLESFLMEFECAAQDALWPKEQWAGRLAPCLSGEAKAMYQTLPPSTAEDYDQLKEAILDHLSVNEETFRRRFRSLIFTERAKPRSVALQLQEWGRRWLKPEIRSPDEIVEIIVVEQFIKILPVGAGEWFNDCHMKTLDILVKLIETYFPEEDVRSEEGNCVRSAVWGEEENLTEGTKGISGFPELVIVKSENVSTMEEDQKPWVRDSRDAEEKELTEDSDTELVIVKSENESMVEEEQKPWVRDSLDSEEKELTEDTSTVLSDGNGLAPSSEYERSFIKRRRETGKRLHTCTKCGKIFTLKSELIRHQRTHTTARLYVCNECGKSFRQLSYLKRHQQLHTGEKPYQCIECGKSFNRSEHLIKHLRIHTGEKPYTCNVCLKSFSQTSTLKCHRRVHTKEKPYTCTDCGKTFRFPNAVKTHRRIHSGEKPYSCSDCGKSFISRGQCTRHQKIHTRNPIGK